MCKKCAKGTYLQVSSIDASYHDSIDDCKICMKGSKYSYDIKFYQILILIQQMTNTCLIFFLNKNFM